MENKAASKPYHLLTQKERLAQRMAQNRAMDVKIERDQAPIRARRDRQIAMLFAASRNFLNAAPHLTDRQFVGGLELLAHGASRIK